MRWMRRAVVFAVSAVALTASPAALAITLAPPGKAGADQYFETVPSSSGNAAPPSSGGGSGATATHALATIGHGAAGAAGLARLGKDGSAAAALAAVTAPPPAATSATPRPGVRKVPPDVSVNPSASATGGVADTLTGSDAGGLGAFFPLLLVATLIAALGIAAQRTRGRGADLVTGA
jgi:hypothetical protein